MSQNESQSDPIYRSSLRELKWILLIWFCSCVWVIVYCGLFGYQSGDRPLTTVFGVPSWVFWGIFVPWIIAASVSCWFALTQMEDHPLGEAPEADSGREEDSDG